MAPAREAVYDQWLQWALQKTGDDELTSRAAADAAFAAYDEGWDPARAAQDVIESRLRIQPNVQPEELAPSLPTEDIAAKLAQLAQLRDGGLISVQEYDAKRAELLARL